MGSGRPPNRAERTGMNPTEESLNYGGIEFATSRVRRNAASAGFAALCLIYFGFFMWVMPTITDLASFGNAFNQYTMRIGGVGMGIIALASLSGQLWILMADAALSVIIGLGLIGSSLMMIVGSGSMDLNLLLYIVFGIMFVSAGVRNGHAFVALRPHCISTKESVQTPPSSPREGSMAELLRKRQPMPAPAPEAVRETRTAPKPRQEAAPKPNPPPTKTGPSTTREDSPPPSDGYLASFANKKPRPPG